MEFNQKLMPPKEGGFEPQNTIPYNKVKKCVERFLSNVVACLLEETSALH